MLKFLRTFFGLFNRLSKLQNVFFPIQVLLDNKGYFIARNTLVKRTKNLHIKYLLIREYVEEGYVNIEFVTSERK